MSQTLREKLENKLTELGIPFRKNWKDATLKKKLEEHEASQPKEPEATAEQPVQEADQAPSQSRAQGCTVTSSRKAGGV